jgi:hypothetical protein
MLKGADRTKLFLSLGLFTCAGVVGLPRKVGRSLGCLFLFLLSCQPIVAAVLYLPRVQSDQVFETGLALSNTESRTGTATVSAYDSTGRLVNQISLSLRSLGQAVGTASAMLGLSAAFRGWVRIDSDVELDGMCLLFRRSDGLLSEAPAVKLPDGTQYLAHVAVGGG